MSRYEGLCYRYRQLQVTSFCRTDTRGKLETELWMLVQQQGAVWLDDRYNAFFNLSRKYFQRRRVKVNTEVQSSLTNASSRSMALKLPQVHHMLCVREPAASRSGMGSVLLPIASKSRAQRVWWWNRQIIRVVPAEGTQQPHQGPPRAPQASMQQHC